MIIRLLFTALFTIALSAQAFDFRSEPIRAHMKFLASDLLEGRGAGTRGYDIAANYVAAQFEAAGVAPGAGGSYFQVIPFRKTIPDDRSTVTITPDGRPSMLLRYGDGFATAGDPLHPDRTVEGRVTVVGVVRGSDPKLRDEYLVYSSHLDHVGITEPVNGDAINNGAFDNASGIAALIEIAKAMASQKPAPRRSVLFLATTAEEKGLRGADYFASNPTVPRTQLVGNINIDQVMMIDAVSDVIVHGIDASTLGDVARRVAAKHSIGISDDPFPEEVVFVRSDQYPFVKRGIPALYIDPGYKAVAPGVDAKQNQMAWIKSRYHTPSDDLGQKMDFSVPAALARFDFLIGLEVANADARPAWKPGNFFGERFGRR